MGDLLSESVWEAEITDKIRVVEIIERINLLWDDHEKFAWFFYYLELSFWTRIGSRVVFGKGSEEQANEMGDFFSESVSGAEITDKIRVVEIIERKN